MINLKELGGKLIVVPIMLIFFVVQAIVGIVAFLAMVASGLGLLFLIGLVLVSMLSSVQNFTAGLLIFGIGAVLTGVVIPRKKPAYRGRYPID